MKVLTKSKAQRHWRPRRYGRQQLGGSTPTPAPKALKADFDFLMLVPVHEADSAVSDNEA